MRVGIDVGTATILAWTPERGIILNEPSILARDAESGQVLASGTAARQMLGRTPADVKLIHPVVAGKLADPEAAVDLIRHALGRTLGWRWSLRPTIAISIGDPVSSYACQALQESLRKHHMGGAQLVPRALAAARGAGLPIDRPQGQAVINLGAGGTEIAILSMGQVISSKFIPVGGDTLDEAIQRHLHTEHGVDISLVEAQEVKHQLGFAGPSPNPDATMIAHGRDQANGLPATPELRAEEISKAMLEPLERILAGLQQALEQVPPALAADLVDRGLTMTGGGALLHGLNEFLQTQTQLPIRVAENPQACVAAGLFAAAAEPEKRGWFNFRGKKAAPTAKTQETTAV